MLALSAGAGLLLTAVHHLYGASVYNTPWRMQVAFVAAPGMIVIALSLFAATRYAGTTPGRVSAWLAIVVIALVPIAAIGLFEGAYNHLLKNVLYFSGASRELMVRLFPPPTYEIPDNWFFEITGVLQFFVSLPTIYLSYLLWRTALRRATPTSAQTSEDSRR